MMAERMRAAKTLAAGEREMSHSSLERMLSKARRTLGHKPLKGERDTWTVAELITELRRFGKDDLVILRPADDEAEDERSFCVYREHGAVIISETA
jgi:hypothetical protein